MGRVDAVNRQREQALAAAQTCARLLRERFGARRVILFGSAARPDTWHAGSDIDVAVEGLAPDRFFAAYSACRDLLPHGMELDLVPLEQAYPELRARILGEVEMPDNPVQALKALVEDELIALDRLAQEMGDLLAERGQRPTRTDLRAMASMLHEFYNGVERILERLAVGFGEGLPQGSQWHSDLLPQMATAREEKRQAVIDEPLRARLKDYLDFRRFYRHAYGYTLEWNQLRWKVEMLSDTLTLLRDQLHAFFDALTLPSSE